MPYEFSVLPIMVLGNINEQFLGKVIQLTPSQPGPFNLCLKNPDLLSSFRDVVKCGRFRRWVQRIVKGAPVDSLIQTITKEKE